MTGLLIVGNYWWCYNINGNLPKLIDIIKELDNLILN